MTKLYQFLFAAMLFASSENSFASAKKNLCSITINSSDEAQLFKSQLSPKQWNFIEIAPTDASSGSKNWFSEACQQNIRCDVLIISGHFGGFFFGSSKLNLTMDELEKNSCDQKCDGILKQPREVFLFGCNTLASKDQDERTPEQYMQVLLADGFSMEQASQIVSFRYSGYGDSFKQRMTGVFATTPRIYGYSSAGPKGVHVSPFLKKYLQSRAADYANFDAYDKKLGTKKNEKLLTALSKFGITQAQGSIPNLQNVEEKPYCYIRSEKVTSVQKLTYIQGLFKTNSAIKMLSHIEEFLYRIKNNPGGLTVDEKKIFDQLSTDEHLRTDLMSLLQLKGDIYLPLKINILKTLEDLGLISAAYYKEAFRQLIDFQTPFTIFKMNMMCSLDKSSDIAFDHIPQQRWQELEFLSAIICLKPQRKDIQLQMLEAIKKSIDPALRATALWYFYYVPSDETSVHFAIATALNTDPELYVRQSALMLLKKLKPTAPAVKNLISESLKKEQDPILKKQIFELLTTL